MEEITFADIYFFYFSSFIFKEFEKHNPLEAIVIVKEELGSIDIDDIGNLEDLLRIVFIHEKCGNLEVFVDGGELTRNISKEKKPGVLQAYRYLLCDKCYRKEYFIIANVEYCESEVNMIIFLGNQ